MGAEMKTAYAIYTLVWISAVLVGAVEGLWSGFWTLLCSSLAASLIYRLVMGKHLPRLPQKEKS